MIALVAAWPPLHCVDRTRRGTPVRKDLHLVFCHFIALKRAIDFVVVSLVDPFIADCIVFDKDTTHYSTSKFYDKHGIQEW